VGKNAKIGIAAGVVVVIALVLVLSGNALLGLGILVLGGLGVAALYQRLPDDGDAPARPKARDGKGKGKSKLDQALEDRLGDAPRDRTAPPTARPSAGGGLPTWSPSGLDTWTPPAEKDEPAAIEPPAAKEEAPAASEWDSWDDDWDGATVVEDEDAEDENPLAALDRLDEIDPIAEVERLEGLSDEEKTPPKKSGFSFSSAPPVINEESIETADDIMAASEAMELHVEAGGDSELAKLLAKVQARLSAYE
jgi:hypothetical protein